MVEIKEFCAVMYNKEKLKKLNLGFKDVVCPPYDVISEHLYKTLSKNKYNFIHLELPTGLKNLGNKKYDKAKNTLTLWKRNKILVQDEIPAIYVYEQTFYYPLNNLSQMSNKQYKGTKIKEKDNEKLCGTKKYVRRGFFCISKVDPKYKTVLPHEQTKPKPVEDRLTLLKTLKMQTSPVFCLVEDNKNVLNKTLEKIVSNTTPKIVFEDELGSTHKFYKLISKEKIDFIKKFFVDKKLFIADGHHRYKTACAYLNEFKIKNKQISINAQYFMTYICPLSDDGLLILPTHRALAGRYVTQYIDKYFDLKEWDGKTVAEVVVYHSGKFKVMVPKKTQIKNLRLEFDDISYVLLNETILKNVPKEQIFYHQEIQEVVSWAERYGGYAFLVQPLSKEKFQSVVEKNFLLPPKTTYFFPKVVSGLCEYVLE